jgi:hypothetical protein
MSRKLTNLNPTFTDSWSLPIIAESECARTSKTLIGQSVSPQHRYTDRPNRFYQFDAGAKKIYDPGYSRP